MSCVRSSEGGFQVVSPFGICGPIDSESSMSNRIRLGKFRCYLTFTLSASADVNLNQMHANPQRHRTAATSPGRAWTICSMKSVHASLENRAVAARLAVWC